MTIAYTNNKTAGMHVNGVEVQWLEAPLPYSVAGQPYIVTRLRLDSGSWRYLGEVYNSIYCAETNENHFVGATPALGKHFSLVYALRNAAVRLPYMSISAAYKNIDLSGWHLYDSRYANGNQSILIDGVQMCQSSVAWSADDSIQSYLTFGCTDDVGTKRFAGQGARWKAAKVWHNDVLAGDFVPVRFFNDDGIQEGGMYDRVQHELLRSSGKEKFIIGPDVRS